MRLLITLVIFLMVGPATVGSMIIPLTDPSWGFDAEKYFLHVVGIGVLIALPISYFVAGMIMKRVQAASA